MTFIDRLTGGGFPERHSDFDSEQRLKTAMYWSLEGAKKRGWLENKRTPDHDPVETKRNMADRAMSVPGYNGKPVVELPGPIDKLNDELEAVGRYR